MGLFDKPTFEARPAPNSIAGKIDAWIGNTYQYDDDAPVQPNKGPVLPPLTSIIDKYSSKLLNPLGVAPTPLYAPEGGNLVGRFNGQIGFASANNNDVSSAVADAIIGVPTLTPAEQTRVNKALAFQTAEGVDAPKDSTINVDWGKGFGLMARRNSIEKHDIANLVANDNYRDIFQNLELEALAIPEGNDLQVNLPVSSNSQGLNPSNVVSGLTFGSGVDIGQHNVNDLLNKGIPQSVIDKMGDWVGLNPDTITDANGNTTGAPALKVARDNAASVLAELKAGTKEYKKAQALATETAAAYLAARTRGHALLRDRFNTQKANGTLPIFTPEEVKATTISMWDSARSKAASDLGADVFNRLPRDAQYVVTADAYHRGSVLSAIKTAASQDNATALSIANAMPDRWAGRRDNIIKSLEIFKTDSEGATKTLAPKTSPRPKPRPAE